ncbi:MAG: signal peptidase I [Aquifex sp.]|nr:MAG: signal peptidase I [Aquifex sp.]
MRKQFLELFLIILAVLFIREFIAQAYTIPSASMEPTLLVGDFILVNKLVYKLSEPMRGDMVVFKYPRNPNIDFIKRIIAKGGDTVEFFPYYDEKNNVFIYKVAVNGKLYELTYEGEKTYSYDCYQYREKLHREDGEVIEHDVCFRNSLLKVYGMVSNAISSDLCLKYSEDGFCVKFVVPDGYYFVMGDNRDNSMDSRFWGFVPRENIEGKAFVIYYSGKTPSLTPEEANPLTAVRQIIYALIHPRFSRIGKPLINR